MRIYSIIMMLEEQNLAPACVDGHSLRSIHSHLQVSLFLASFRPPFTRYLLSFPLPPSNGISVIKSKRAYALINSRSPFFGNTSSICGSSKGYCSTSFARKLRWTEDLTLVLEETEKLLSRKDIL